MAAYWTEGQQAVIDRRQRELEPQTERFEWLETGSPWLTFPVKVVLGFGLACGFLLVAALVVGILGTFISTIGSPRR
jgi:hypothetical protein